MCNLLEKQSVAWKTAANRLIYIMIKMDTIWWNLHGSVLCMGKKKQLRGLQAQSVHTIERLEEQIQDDI